MWARIQNGTVTARKRLLRNCRWSDYVPTLRCRRECIVGHNRRTARSHQERADTNAELPAWIKPQLCQLAKEAPSGQDWAHELKFDGYRIHARIVRTDVRLLTRTGIDWTHKYPAIAARAPHSPSPQAYLDGELCRVRPDGVTSFALIQNARDRRGGSDLVYFVFDLLYIDGQDLMPLPLSSRKARSASDGPMPSGTAIIRSGTVRRFIGAPASSGSRHRLEAVGRRV